MVFGRISGTPCVPLHTSCAFTCHHVGIGAADTGVFDRFMHIQGGVVFGSGFYNISIMEYIVLSMMVVSVRKATGITGFHRVNA